MTRELLTASQVLARYGVSPYALGRWVRLGRLSAVRVSAGTRGFELRFDPAAIAAAIAASRFDETGSRRPDPAMG